MADVEKTIDIVFGAVDNTGNTIGRVGSSLDEMAGSVQQLTDPLATATDNIVKAEAAIVAIGTAAAGFAAKEAAEFESGLTEVSKTSDIAGENLQRLAGRIQEMAVEMGTSTAELNETAAAAGRLGIEGQENILDFTETVTKIGAATDVAGEQAATAFARILNVTGESADNIEQLGSVVVELGNNVAATESEILKAANETSRAAAEFGLASTEVAALGAALAETGARAEGGATAVGRSMRAIQEAIGEGGESIKRLSELTGIAASDIQQAFQEDALGVFQKFLQGVKDSSKTTQQVLDEFGLATEETLKSLGPLIQNIGDFEAVLKRANAEAENATALEEEFAKVLDTVSKQAERAGAAFEVAAQKIGAQYAPATSDALGATTELFKVIGEQATQDNALGELLDFLSQQLDLVTEQLLGMAEALPEALDQVEIDPLISSLRNLRESLTGLFGDLDLTKPEDLAEAIEFLTDVIGGLTNVTSGIVDSLAPFIQQLAEGAEGAANMDAETQELIGNVLGAAKAVNTLAGALSGVTGILIGAGSVVSGIGQAGIAAAAMSGKFGGAASAAGGLTSSMGRLASTSKGLLGTLTSFKTLGIASVFAFTAERVATAASEFSKMREAQENAAESQERLARKAKTLRDITGDESITTENLIEKTKEYKDQILRVSDATETVKGVSDEARYAFMAAWDVNVEDYTDRVEEAKDKTEEAGDAAKETGNKAQEGGEKGEKGMGLFRGEAEEADKALRHGIIPASEKAGEEGEKAGDKASEGLDKVGESADKVNTKMQKLASEFQDRVISATVEINTSQLEQQTERTQNVLDSMQSNFESTGETIGSLFDNLTEKGLGAGNRGEVLSQIKTENEYRRESFEIQKDLAEQQLRSNRLSEDQAVSMQEVAKQAGGITKEFRGGTVPALETTEQAAKSGAESTRDLRDQAEQASRGLDQTAESGRKVDRVLSETAAKVYEAKVQLDTAQAEAAAERFSSAMEGITGSVESTGSLLGELFGGLNEAGPANQLDFTSAIQEEERRRDKALRLQERLIEAEVEYYEARTESLKDGGGEIQVTADGLEPELEAFMWKIVERLHVRATEDQQEFLLGLNGGG